jgi:hypothetical protein
MTSPLLTTGLLAAERTADLHRAADRRRIALAVKPARRDRPATRRFRRTRPAGATT